MLSIPLLKRTIMKQKKLWIFYTGILLFLMLSALGMYDTKMAAALQTMPEIFRVLFGMEDSGDGLTGYLASCLFGGCFLILPMFYELILANRLIAKQMEDGLMVHLIATPNTRNSIVRTKAYFLILSLLLMFLSTILPGLLCSIIWYPHQLVVSQFLLLNIGVFCLHIAISGIGFLASCICDDSRKSYLIGAGIPILFYLFHLIARLGGVAGLFRFVTIFTLFDLRSIMGGSISICWTLPALLLLGSGCYLAGIRLFEKRDLPL